MPEPMPFQNDVLLVEDSPDDEALTVRALKALNLGIKVSICRDGLQASDYVRAISEERPRLMILDLKLPKINGIELLEIIRANLVTSQTPVVMLTSSDEYRDVIQCYQAGASGFVRKPVDYDEYVSAVKSLGIYWLRYNLSPPSQNASASGI